jgi:hypothetical protein
MASCPHSCMRALAFGLNASTQVSLGKITILYFEHLRFPHLAIFLVAIHIITAPSQILDPRYWTLFLFYALFIHSPIKLRSHIRPTQSAYSLRPFEDHNPLHAPLVMLYARLPTPTHSPTILTDALIHEWTPSHVVSCRHAANGSFSEFNIITNSVITRSIDFDCGHKAILVCYATVLTCHPSPAPVL